MGTALSKDKNTVTHRCLGGAMQDSERKTKHRGRQNEVIFCVCVMDVDMLENVCPCTWMQKPESDAGQRPLSLTILPTRQVSLNPRLAV